MFGTERKYIYEEVYEFLKNIIGGDFMSCELNNIFFGNPKYSVTEFFKDYSIKEHEFKDFLRLNKIMVKDDGFQPTEERKNLYRLILEWSKVFDISFQFNPDKSKAYIYLELYDAVHRFYTPKGKKAVNLFYSNPKKEFKSIVGQDLISIVRFKIYQEGKELIKSTQEYVENLIL